MNRVDQLLERHGKVSVHYHLVEEVRVQEFYPLRAVQDLLELFVLQERSIERVERQKTKTKRSPGREEKLIYDSEGIR